MPLNIAALLEPYTLTGFVQAEYHSRQESEDQLGQGGVPLNKERFLVRRARVRLEGNWKYTAAQIEIDGNTVRGPELRLLHGFGTVRLPGKDPNVPIVAATVGLFDTPFGYELTEAPRTRTPMERSTASQALFPGEPDLGARLWGGLSFFRWSFALMNGEPLGQRTGFPALTPRAAKDVVFRIGVDTEPRKDLRISGGVSGLRGKGFHPGTDATKGTIEWKDGNENGSVEPIELTGRPGTAATPSQLFERWAVGADAQVRFKTGLGQTLVYGEVVIAKNLDRGLFVADPILTGVDSRELGFYAGIMQDVTRYGVVGFRYDHYDPNADYFDKRGGKLLPTSQVIHTFSPIVGLVLPDRARLMFQYDIITDKLARNESGLPSNQKNNAFTLRLQVNL